MTEITRSCVWCGDEFDAEDHGNLCSECGFAMNDVCAGCEDCTEPDDEEWYLTD